MIWLTDIKGTRIAINKKHLVAVFKIKEGENIGKTMVCVVGAQLIVEEEDYDIVGQMAN